MKKYTITLLIVSLAITFCLYGASVQKFGKELSLKETTKISTLLDEPDNHVNKAVRVEGTIVAVCEHKGCWLELSSDKEFQKLRIKVKDGDMVFPLTSKGKHAVVEGSLYEIKMAKEDAMKTHHSCNDKAKKTACTDKAKKTACAHKAKSAKAKASCDSAKKGGKKIYQMKPYAVLIKNK